MHLQIARCISQNKFKRYFQQIISLIEIYVL